MTSSELIANQQMLAITVGIILDVLQIACIAILMFVIVMWGYVGWDKVQVIRKRKTRESADKQQALVDAGVKEHKFPLVGKTQPTLDTEKPTHTPKDNLEQRRRAAYAAMQIMSDIEAGFNVSIYRTCDFDQPDHTCNISTIDVSIAVAGLHMRSPQVVLRGYTAIYLWEIICKQTNTVDVNLQQIMFNPKHYNKFRTTDIANAGMFNYTSPTGGINPHDPTRTA